MEKNWNWTTYGKERTTAKATETYPYVNEEGSAEDSYAHTDEYYADIDRNQAMCGDGGSGVDGRNDFDYNLYKFNEAGLINEFQEYVDSTYSAHYSKNKFQSTEFIIDCGHGEGFALGNVLKYVQRYGNKNGYNRADLMKVLHYALIALHNHDLQELER
ncbi:DUF3310 domain-containing protein [bacterium]|nr:DUF3310 domain-containing protein [bacterium]